MVGAAAEGPEGPEDSGTAPQHWSAQAQDSLEAEEGDHRTSDAGGEADVRLSESEAVVGSATPPVRRWLQMEPGVGPATRGRHTLGIDAERGILLMFGGQNYDLRAKYNDIATYDLHTDRWAFITDDNTRECEAMPYPRSSHASVVTRDYLYVFGGATGKSFQSAPGCCRDAFTWRYSFCEGTWSRVRAKGLDALSARYGHTVVLAPNDVVYLYGGMTDKGCDHSTFKVDLRSLEVEQLKCSFVGATGDRCDESAFDFSQVSPPTAEEIPSTGCTAQQVRACVTGFGHTAVYNPYTNAMYVLGGTSNGHIYRSTFLRLDLTTREWSVEKAQNTAPECRYVHCATYDESRNAMYVFGGYSGAYRNDVHEYDFNTRRWSEIKPNQPSPEGPCLRSGACCVAWEGHLYVCGGCDDQRYYNDVWKMRPWGDTVSLRDTMLNWLAWQQTRGFVGLMGLGCPSSVEKQLHKRREQYRLIIERLPRTSKHIARM
eukprot:TRINITY_DN24508_c0_g1_i1.p1 TRINITY_DN24508_c0_g1~~TRINITY_DN24508_c0_g1_i1.p1  ORF type:complete len:487 (+),score=129.37 TRINITY_DN24508_c0_g1_i1:92-1552(+)